MECGDVREEWKLFKYVVIGCAESVCGLLRVHGRLERGVNGSVEKKVTKVWL